MPITRSPPHTRGASSRSGSCTSNMLSPPPTQEEAPDQVMLTSSQSPPSVASPSVTSPKDEPHGAVAAAIQALPIEVGTLVSPTITIPSGNSGSTCKGGPGNPTCNLEVKNNQLGVQCDICLSWFHALCQDISRTAYNAMKRHTVLAFICSMCKKLPNLDKLQPRAPLKDEATQVSPEGQSEESDGMKQRIASQSVNSSAQVDVLLPGVPLGNSSDATTFSQLAAKVDNLEKVLKEQITELSKSIHSHNQSCSSSAGGHPQSNTNSGKTYAEALNGVSTQRRNKHSTTQVDRQSVSYLRTTHAPKDQTPQLDHSEALDYRSMVREELLELDERKKRRSSLVIRGLKASSVAEAAAKFAEVTESLIGEKVVLSDTCRIRSDADLYRGNVHNNRQRKLILEQAKHLKDSSFSQVYIKRDLTYLQRMQLQARFQQHQMDNRNFKPVSGLRESQPNSRSSIPTVRIIPEEDQPEQSTPAQEETSIPTPTSPTEAAKSAPSDGHPVNHPDTETGSHTAFTDAEASEPAGSRLQSGEHSSASTGEKQSELAASNNSSQPQRDADVTGVNHPPPEKDESGN